MDLKLDSYQHTIVNHLLSHDIAYHMVGMSLGKTACTLTAINELFADMATKGVLIVAPLRVATIVWPMEVRKWDQFNWMRIANFRTPEGKSLFRKGSAQLYIINYEQLPKLREFFKANAATSNAVPPWDTVVWDEISKAKNPKSKRIESVRTWLSGHCLRQWGLTGTPASNGYLDLFAQVRLLDRGERLGKSYHHFRRTYFAPTDYMEYNWVLKDDGKDRIHSRLADISLSMKTSDYLDLPDMVEVDHDIALPAAAKKTYKELEKELLTVLEDGTEVVGVNAAVLVNKLLQITSGAVYGDGAVYDDERRHSIIHNSKVAEVAKIVKGIKGNCLLVYNYIHERDRLLQEIPEAKVFDDDRVCETWNSGGIKCLLVHPKSMSHGLNLQGGGADVVWSSLTYSREDYDQLNARLCRRGQDEVTRIHRVLTRDTIDYAVAGVLKSKGDRQEELLKAMKQMKGE